MIIHPRVRRFICTTAHPSGCEANVEKQVRYAKSRGEIKDAPKRVLVIGSSSGYGLSSRIVAAFSGGASTIGLFFEKPGTEEKPGTAGYYNAAAFEKISRKEGVYAKSINGDAFSHRAKQKAIELIRKDLSQVDLVIYSMASPVRRLPESGRLVRSYLKPVSERYTSKAVDTDRDVVVETHIDPATEREIQDTITVMGGEDWELWIDALDNAGVLAEGCRSIAYSYIGTKLTWPIYWKGTLGFAKRNLERVGDRLSTKLSLKGGSANVAILKSVVTQASAAIPVMPLYIAIVFKKMREKAVHEGCIEQMYRLFHNMYRQNGDKPEVDEKGRFRLDDWELRDDIQSHCQALWQTVSTENIHDLTDYDSYKREFLRLFGFGITDVDYQADIDPKVIFDLVDL